MNLETLNGGEYTTLYQKNEGGELIFVKENSEYRWLEYGGTSIQSLMNKTTPTLLLTPVFQSLLFFVLLKTGPLTIVNLGLGGAAIERSLTVIPNLSITSVDASYTMIEIAKRYFNLPSSVKVVCDTAEQFVQQAPEQYDVVLCDLFVGEKSPDCLFTELFYQQLSQIMTADAVVMINLQADTEPQLMSALSSIKQCFPYAVLFEFEDYSNITIAASAALIPDKNILQARLMSRSNVDFTGLDKVIDRMHYLFEATATEDSDSK